MDIPRGAGERVLVVEDDTNARGALRQILEALGYTVTATASAEEADLLPESPPFALLLADLVLPGAPGSELATGLKERWPGLRVILMSGYRPDEALLRDAEAGRIRLLQKPFDAATLAAEVRAALTDET